MFTDHGRLPDVDFTDQVAARSGKVVLRGTELNVFVDAWKKPENKVEKTAFFHLLIGFDPEARENADYWFTDLTRHCRRETRIIGGKVIAGFVDQIDTICDTLEESGAIIVTAHLHTEHDAFKSRSVDDIYTDPEFLRVARERFTALEVTDPATAAYFDGEHDETGRLRKTCIQSSDAHEIGHIGRRVTYAQMETPSFVELKAALNIPFRVSLSEPEEPENYIIGIHVQGQFFPDVWLRLSPYCNALIGVKGSGKTSILECLRFALGSTVPESRKEDVSRHLRSTLGPAGVVRVLIRRSDGAKLLVKRSINSEAEFEITFEDDTQETVSNPDALMFPSYILGWNEIEQVATDPKIRQVYLDTIAGRERICQLKERAEADASQIRFLHEQVANKYTQFRSLHGQVTRLEDLRSGLQQLTDSKLVSLRDEYEASIRQREAINGLTRTLQSATEGVGDRAASFLPLDDVDVLEGESPLSPFALVASAAIGDLRRRVADFAEEHRSRVCAAVKKLKDQSPHLELAFEEFASRYAESIAVLSPEQQRLLESHRRVLEDTRALPELRLKQQQAKNEVMVLLTTLIEMSNQVAVSLDKQTDLRTRKVEEIADELVHYGVMLRVSALSQRRAIDELAQRNAAGADIFNQISSFTPDEKRYHRRLAQAYRNLKNDLINGFTLF